MSNDQSPGRPAGPPDGALPVLGQRLASGLFYWFTYLAALISGTIVTSMLIARATGIEVRSASELDAEQLLVLLVGGQLAATAFALLSAHVLGGLRASGLRWRGAAASLRLAMPVVVVVIAVPLVVAIVTGEGSAAGVTARLLALIVVFSVLVGVSEEVAFRGVLFNLLGGRGAPVAAVAGSSLLFGVAHVMSPGATAAVLMNALAVMLAVAVPFALVAFRTGTLVGPIVAHALIDVFGVAMLGGIERPPITTPQAVTTLVMAVLLAAAYGTWFTRTGGARVTDWPSAGTPRG